MFAYLARYLGLCLSACKLFWSSTYQLSAVSYVLDGLGEMVLIVNEVENLALLN